MERHGDILNAISIREKAIGKTTYCAIAALWPSGRGKARGQSETRGHQGFLVGVASGGRWNEWVSQGG